MAARSSPEELAEQARFVFRGTVKKTKAATMPVPDKTKTAVVRVDEIIHAPPLMKDWAGKDITVLLGGRKKVAKGQEAVFYANGWLYGEGIAVQALDHHAVGKAPSALHMH